MMNEIIFVKSQNLLRGVFQYYDLFQAGVGGEDEEGKILILSLGGRSSV